MILSMHANRKALGQIHCPGMIKTLRKLAFFGGGGQGELPQHDQEHLRNLRLRPYFMLRCCCCPLRLGAIGWPPPPHGAGRSGRSLRQEEGRRHRTGGRNNPPLPADGMLSAENTLKPL